MGVGRIVHGSALGEGLSQEVHSPVLLAQIGGDASPPEGVVPPQVGAGQGGQVRFDLPGLLGPAQAGQGGAHAPAEEDDVHGGRVGFTQELPVDGQGLFNPVKAEKGHGKVSPMDSAHLGRALQEGGPATFGKPPGPFRLPMHPELDHGPLGHGP